MSWDIPTAEKCPKCGGVIYKKLLKDKEVLRCENGCNLEDKEN